jgi:hypothetical protein
VQRSFVFVFGGQIANNFSSTQETEGAVMEALADELVLHIFCFCGARDVAALEATCLRLASLARDDLLWRHLFRGWFHHHLALGREAAAAAAADSGAAAADPFHALDPYRMDWPWVRSAVAATNQHEDDDEGEEEAAVPRGKVALVFDTEPHSILGGRRPFRKRFEKGQFFIYYLLFILIIPYLLC